MCRCEPMGTVKNVAVFQGRKRGSDDISRGVLLHGNPQMCFLLQRVPLPNVIKAISEDGAHLYAPCNRSGKRNPRAIVLNLRVRALIDISSGKNIQRDQQPGPYIFGSSSASLLHPHIHRDAHQY